MKSKESSKKTDPQRIHRSSIFQSLVGKIGWILVFFGGLIILIYWGCKITEDLVLDISFTFFLKIGVLTVIGGLVILLISLIRYQLFSYKQEKATCNKK